MRDHGPSPQDLQGRCAVVTGAARGIGLAITQQLQHAGCDVIAVDKDTTSLKERFDGEPGCAWIPHDFSLGDEHFDGAVTNGEALAERVLERAEASGFEFPSLIVNNVGVASGLGSLDLRTVDFDEVQRVNVRTPWHFTQRLVDEFLRVHASATAPAPRAAILFISSLHDTVPAHRPHYSTSKAAVTMLTRELAADLGKHGIRVNTISPGWIRTDPDPTSPEQQAKQRTLVPRIPLGRPGTPDDVARLALVLLSDRWSGYVTGVNVPVDGGLAVDTWVPPPDVGWDAPG